MKKKKVLSRIDITSRSGNIHNFDHFRSDRNHGNPGTVNGGCRPARIFLLFRRYRRTRSHAFSKEKPGHEIFNGHSTTHVLSMARSKRRNSAISTRNIALPIFHLPFPLKIITSSIVKFVKIFSSAHPRKL